MGDSSPANLFVFDCTQKLSAIFFVELSSDPILSRDPNAIGTSNSSVKLFQDSGPTPFSPVERIGVERPEFVFRFWDELRSAIRTSAAEREDLTVLFSEDVEATFPVSEITPPSLRTLIDIEGIEKDLVDDPPVVR